MNYLISGLLLFVVLHSLRIVVPSFRDRLIAGLGKPLWFSIHGVLSLVSLWLIAAGYGESRQSPLWIWFPPLWLNHVTLLLMLVSFVYLVGGLVPGSHIRRFVRAPVTFGVILWSTAHLLSNPTTADMLLFGTFFVWALLLQRHVLSRPHEPASATLSRTLLALAGALAAYLLVLFWLHSALIGVSPLS
ncbi:NnrU family protein [uncultured Thalassolituus sp.]|uniref:NnrU family protein n=1 Tax=uncultured Thalassolituus sp. TaxID=285273 RepID=UPI002622E8E2|nr:NnrU family protein [uncultured Thalassolituus sp.]